MRFLKNIATTPNRPTPQPRNIMDSYMFEAGMRPANCQCIAMPAVMTAKPQSVSTIDTRRRRKRSRLSVMPADRRRKQQHPGEADGIHRVGSAARVDERARRIERRRVRAHRFTTAANAAGSVERRGVVHRARRSAAGIGKCLGAQERIEHRDAPVELEQRLCRPAAAVGRPAHGRARAERRAQWLVLQQLCEAHVLRAGSDPHDLHDARPP